MPVELETQRLVLGVPSKADLHAIFDIVSDPDTSRYLGPAPTMQDHFMRFSRGAGSWLLYGYGNFTVRLKNDPAPIGICGIFHSWRGLGADFDDLPEAGWIFSRDHVGKGLGREAMDAVMRWFESEFGPRRIVAMIDHDNAPSLALAAALGFQIFRDGCLPGSEEPLALLEKLPL